MYSNGMDVNCKMAKSNHEESTSNLGRVYQQGEQDVETESEDSFHEDLNEVLVNADIRNSDDSSILNDQDTQSTGRFLDKFKSLNESIIASVKKYPPVSNSGPGQHPMCDRHIKNFNLQRYTELYLDDGGDTRTDDGQIVRHAIVEILNLETDLDEVIGRSFENNGLTLAVGDDPRLILNWTNCPYAKVIEYDLPAKFERDVFIRSLLIEKFKKHCMTLKVSMFGACYIFDGEFPLS